MDLKAIATTALPESLMIFFEYILLERKKEMINNAPPSLRVAQASMRHEAGLAVCRLLRALEVRDILEIGTCVGIGAGYMISGAQLTGKRVSYTGLEGNPGRIKLAEETLSILFKQTVDWDIVKGHFDDTFEPTVMELDPLEFVYLDGRHKEQPTVNMFDRCVGAMPGGGWILADDLNWSPGMRAAARQIRARPRVEWVKPYAGKELFKIAGV